MLYAGILRSIAARVVGRHQAAMQRLSVFVRTYHRRVGLLNGKLTILFLNGFFPNAVPLLFGELFTMVLYDGVAADPGSPKMRKSLERHLRQIKPHLRLRLGNRCSCSTGRKGDSL